MITLVSLLLVCLSGYAQGELEVVQKKKHWGVQQDSEWLIKPKYDSLVQADKVILTGYRKNKIFYLNAEGEQIHKNRINGTGEFEDGMGIVQDKKGKYAILDRTGKMLSEPTFLYGSPVRYGNFVFLKHRKPGAYGDWEKNGCIYRETGLIKAQIEAVSIYQNLLIAEESHERFSSTTERTYFDLESGELLEEDVFAVKDTMGHFFMEKYDGKTTLYEKSTQKWVKSLDKIELLDSAYFISKKGQEKSLYLWKAHQLLIRTNCERFEFRPEVIYAVKKENSGAGLPVEIYDYQGSPLQRELVILHEFEDGRMLFQKNGLQYIGKENGDTLSIGYPRISPVAVNGFRIVSDASHYGYINDRTYQKLPMEYPILHAQKRSGSSGGGGGFFKAIASLVMVPIAVTAGVLLAIPSRGKSMTMVRGILGNLGGESSTPETSYEVMVPDVKQLFMEGYAIFCTYEPSSPEAFNVIGDQSALTYNYVDTAGKVLNAKKFGDCFPFQGGKAWVKDGRQWVQINKKGIRIGQDGFENLSRHDNGFFEGWNTYTHTFLIFTNRYSECVLFDQSNNRLHKGVFSKIELEGNVYYGTRGEKRIKIAEVPAQMAD
jgi:hypothetical protein